MNCLWWYSYWSGFYCPSPLTACIFMDLTKLWSSYFFRSYIMINQQSVFFLFFFFFLLLNLIFLYSLSSEASRFVISWALFGIQSSYSYQLLHSVISSPSHLNITVVLFLFFGAGNIQDQESHWNLQHCRVRGYRAYKQPYLIISMLSWHLCRWLLDCKNNSCVLRGFDMNTLRKCVLKLICTPASTLTFYCQLLLTFECKHTRYPLTVDRLGRSVLVLFGCNEVSVCGHHILVSVDATSSPNSSTGVCIINNHGY